MKNKIVVIPGNEIPRTMAGRLEMLMQLMEMTIKTGKPGRPKKLLTLKRARKLFKESL